MTFDKFASPEYIRTKSSAGTVTNTSAFEGSPNCPVAIVSIDQKKHTNCTIFCFFNCYNKRKILSASRLHFETHLRLIIIYLEFTDPVVSVSCFNEKDKYFRVSSTCFFKSSSSSIIIIDLK